MKRRSLLAASALLLPGAAPLLLPRPAIALTLGKTRSGALLNPAYFISDTSDPGRDPATGLAVTGGIWLGPPELSPGVPNPDAVLKNGYGDWRLGIATSPPAGFSPGNSFHRVLLNGVSAHLDYFYETNILRLEPDGTIWGFYHDIRWYTYAPGPGTSGGYYWQGNNAANIGPPGDGTLGPWLPGPSPRVVPPFSPSPDGSRITPAARGTGLTTTQDGLWTLTGGDSSNANITLNGIVLASPQPINDMQVYSGVMFFKQGSNWFRWGHTGNVFVPGQNNPTALPIPMIVSFTDPTTGQPLGRAQVLHTTPAGTPVCNVSATMSDGSSFAGTITADPQYFQVVGNQLRLSTTFATNQPIQGGPTDVLAGQNNGWNHEILVFVST